jgi:tRNA(fMet)-specific endonuclease VapC
MRKTAAGLIRARAYLADHTQLTISLINRFEILRGLKARQATSQLAVFGSFFSNNEVLPITDSVIIRAADLWSELHLRGQLIPDADILIAEIAIENGLVLATNNVGDLDRVQGIEIDNWLA